MLRFAAAATWLIVTESIWQLDKSENYRHNLVPEKQAPMLPQIVFMTKSA
jgi:hypothetical protein